jgi:hypothetical protein
MFEYSPPTSPSYPGPTDRDLGRAVEVLVVRTELDLDLPSGEGMGFCARLRRILAAAAPPGRLDADRYRAIFGTWKLFEKVRLQWARDRTLQNS